MSIFTDTLKTLAPTVASALLGPLGGVAVSAIGSIFGMEQPTKDKIEKAFKSGQLTPEQVQKLHELEMQYQDNERERGFKYTELEFKDRDSARKANVEGGTQKMLFWLSLMLLAISLGSEVYILFNGYPVTVEQIVLGRILGLLDAVTMLVLTYWYGSTSNSHRKTELLAQSEALK